MKKFLSLFILILLFAASVFAGTVKIQSMVTAYTLDNANTDSAGGLYKLFIRDNRQTSEATNFYVVDSDISKEDVVIDFVVTQQHDTKTNEAIEITVQAGQLSCMDLLSNAVYSTSEFSFEALGNPSLGEDYLEVQKEIQDDNTLNLQIKYKGSNYVVSKGTTIATFTARWAKSDELSEHPGTYTADLTMQYIIN